MKQPHLHVTTRVCDLPHCGWTGFHFHWRHRRYRTARELSEPDAVAFDRDYAAMSAAHRAGHP